MILTTYSECFEFLKRYHEDPLPEPSQVVDDITIVLSGADMCALYVMFDDHVEVHICTSPRARGKRALSFAKKTIDWIFNNTTFDRIVAKISKKHVKIFASWCGFVFNGEHYEVINGRRC